MYTFAAQRKFFMVFSVVILALLVSVSPLYAQTITTTIGTGTDPVTVAVNPITNKIYVANSFSNTVTIIDGMTNATVTVTVGTNPVALAVDPVTNKIYVVNVGTGDVTVIDGATNATSTVVVGSSPYAVAVNSVTNKIYVSNHQSNSVTVIDGATNATLTVPVGTHPYAVAVNPVTNRVYVTNQDSSNVTVIDGANNTATTIRDSNAAAPVAVAVNPVTNKIYVVNQNSNNMTVIDGATNSTTTVNPVTAGVAMAVNPVTNKIYVSGGGTSNVTVIDGATNSTSLVSVGSSPEGLAVDLVTNKIYVANSGSYNVSVIDGATNLASTLTDPQAVATRAVAVNPVTNKIYVANGGSNNVTVIDGATNATTTVAAGGTPVAVNPVTNKIYVAGSPMTVIDGATNATSTVAAGAGPVAMAVNPLTNKIYVVNQTFAGTVTVIDGATNATTTVAVGQNPADVAVNPVTNKIYVANGGSNGGINVTVIEGATNATTTVATPLCSAVAVNAVTNRIYATCANNTVTVIDGATNATTTVSVGSFPGAVAVNTVTNKIYVLNSQTDTVTVIDGASNATTTVAVGVSADAVAVNPVTNKIYVINGDRFDSSVTVIDGATNATTRLGGVFYEPHSVAVNPVTNKIYVNNGDVAGIGAGSSLTVIDGATNTTTAVATGTGPFGVAVNPVTNKIYVTNIFDNTVTVVSEQQVQPIPLVTAITPLTGNQTAGPTQTFNFTASSSFTPTAPPPQAVYFQLDNWQTPWQPTSGTPPNFTGTTTALTAGPHILYAFATDGQDANSTGVAQQLTGSISAYLFNVVPAVTTPFATTTTLISTQNPANPGDSVPLTATVSSTHFWPTGTVTFLDGATTLGTATLNATAQATFTTSALALGTHSITAQYGGDSNFAASTSGALSQDISTLQSITVSSSSSSVPKGQNQQFIATGHYADGSSGDLTVVATWSSSNTNVATVSNTAGTQGLAAGVGPGSVTITALHGAISGTAPLTVTSQEVVSSYSPSSGTGVTQQFTVVVTDSSGPSDLNQVQLLFNTTTSRLDGCNVYYQVSTNTMNLYNDSGMAFVGGVIPGSATQVSNSQCTLNGAQSSAFFVGNTLTLYVPLTFSGSFRGLKNAYAYVQGNNGTNNGGWQQVGTWTPPIQPPKVLSLAPNSGTGVTQTFTVVASDPAGLGDLNQVQLLFNTSPTRISACNVYYDSATNTLYLYNDAGAAFLTGVTPGSATQASNSQCTLNGAGSSFSTSRNNLTLNVSLTFSGPFTGTKNAYVYAQGNDGSNSGGWAQKGTWTSGQSTTTVVSLTPSSGTGVTQTFTVVATDTSGIADLNQVQLLFNTTPTRTSGCNVYYVAATNILNLYTNDGSGFVGGVTPGSATQASNGQCTLNGAGSSVSTSGNNLTLNVSLTFSGTFTGAKNAYVYVQGNNGSNNGGWQQEGTWTP
jgi:YVTN family beta-propeller protein